MVVGISRLSLRIHTSCSLKDKRNVLRRIKGRTQQRFNVSIAEVADNDLVNRAVIGIAAVGNDRRFVNSLLDKVNGYIEEMYLAEITGYDFELLNY